MLCIHQVGRRGVFWYVLSTRRTVRNSAYSTRVLPKIGQRVPASIDVILRPAGMFTRRDAQHARSAKLTLLYLCCLACQGEIPRTISNLVTLTELNISYNFGITGSLPPELGSMTNLSVLHLYSCDIHGEHLGASSTIKIGGAEVEY